MNVRVRVTFAQGPYRGDTRTYMCRSWEIQEGVLNMHMTDKQTVVPLTAILELTSEEIEVEAQNGVG